MSIGYIRYYTTEQNEAHQLKMIERQKIEKVFIDTASGKNVDRKDFKAMMAFVRAGDTVIVESILERQRESIEIAKTEGKYKGRKPVAVDEAKFRVVCARWRAGEITATAAMQEVELKSNTFYRRVKQLDI